MAPRLELHSLLVALAGEGWKVYFQPPRGKSMEYPCILYRRSFAETSFADNNPYRNTKRYQVTVIDMDPDSLIPDKVSELPMCRYDRFFTADNLNHDVFNLYF